MVELRSKLQESKKKTSIVPVFSEVVRELKRYNVWFGNSSDESCDSMKHNSIPLTVGDGRELCSVLAQVALVTDHPEAIDDCTYNPG